jgi:hypothetical protein
MRCKDTNFILNQRKKNATLKLKKKGGKKQSKNLIKNLCKYNIFFIN